MRYSNIFSKTSKSVSADADSINAKLLTQGGFISKQMAGVYNYLPLGLRVLNKIQNIIRDEMNKLGANEILMPALGQSENYKQTGRDNMDILFSTEGANKSTLFLNPTCEEIVTPLVANYVFSYRDLPMSVYQIQNKFRNEPRAKSGILRGREFNMKDLYSFHPSQEDLDEYYEKVKQVYFDIYNALGLGDGKTILAYASGGVFSKYSHEFQTLCEIGEDTIYVCEKCSLGINKEIIKDQSACPECKNDKLVEKKAIEVGNIFKLGTKFSDAFGFKYSDKDGKKQDVIMASYGIGPSRIMGTLVEVFNDEKGIIWPESVAPYKVHLLNIGKEDDVKEKAEKIYEELLKNKIEVLFDDRDLSAGAKLSDADLIGCPVRVVVSKKTLEKDSVEVKKRNESDFELIKLKDILNNLK